MSDEAARAGTDTADAAAAPGGRGSRIELFDALRGYAITLVVLGHAIQRTIIWRDGATSEPFFALTATFTMPLFFFVSGWLAAGRLRGGPGTVIARRAARLLVPFFAWMPVYYLASRYSIAMLDRVSGDVGSFVDYAITVARNPSLGLWFLPVLFLASVALVFVRDWNPWLGAALMWALAWALSHQLGGIGGLALLFFYWPFVAAGPVVAQVDVSTVETWAKRLFIPLAVALVAVWFLWPRPTTSPGSYVYGYLLGFLGIAASVGLVAWLRRADRLWHLLMYLGTISLGIYVTHLLLLGVHVGRGAVAVLVCFVVAMVGSVAFTWVLSRTWLTRGLFLGDWQRAPKRAP